MPHSCLASHEQAWEESRDLGNFTPEVNLNDDLAWGTAATKHASSWLHVDDDGFGTVVTVKTGAKYWVVARPRNPSLRSTAGFGLKWDPVVPDEDDEMEAVVLRPGTVL